jgi:hypothetical protein
LPISLPRLFYNHDLEGILAEISLNFWSKIILSCVSLASLSFANFGSRETVLKIDFITKDYASGPMAAQNLSQFRENDKHAITLKLNVGPDTLHLCSFVPTKHLVYAENRDTFRLSSIFKATSTDSICKNLNLPDIDALLSSHLNNPAVLKLDAIRRSHPKRLESSNTSILSTRQFKILGWRFFYIPKFSYLTGAISAVLALLSLWLITALPRAKQPPSSEMKNADK